MPKRTLLSLLFAYGMAVAAQAQTAPAATPAKPAVRIGCSHALAPAQAPLLIVDGVPVSDKQLNDLDPADIESISVLKGASPVALYGSQAKNGVLLIATKSAQRATRKSTPQKLLIRPDEISR